MTIVILATIDKLSL